MAMRSILVPLTGTESDDAALQCASQVATRFGGHIDALHVQEDTHYSFPRGEERYNVERMQEATRLAREQVEARTKAAHDKFITCLEGRRIQIRDDPPSPGSPSASWLVVSGNEAAEVYVSARAYDLTVVGRPAPANRKAARETVEAALFGTGRPVLVAPENPPEKLGDTVLIGWNRTIQSAHAVAGAMPFLERAERVVVFMVATGAKQGPSPQDIARALAWNDIETEVKEVAPDSRRVGQLVLDEAKQVGADLVVMGAYSHSRWREMILGGVTRHVLDYADLPVLMAH